MIRVARRHPHRQVRLRRPWLAAGLLGLIAPLMLIPHGSAGAAPARPQGKTAPLNIATYNVSFQAKVSKTAADVRGIADEGADIIALQEMSSAKRRKAVRKALISCGDCTFDGYIPGSAVPGGTPILYRKDRFELLNSGTVKLTEDTYVGPKGSGPSTIRAKYANWVQLRETTTRRKVTLINNHFVPTVQTGDGGPNDNKKRVELYRKHMNGLTALSEDLRKANGGLVFMTGDFNVNYRGDKVVKAPMFPYHALGQIGLQSSFQRISEPKEGTHVLANGFSKRLIDYVFSMERRSLRPDSHTILRGYSSDHRPVVVKFTLKGRGCFINGGTGC